MISMFLAGAMFTMFVDEIIQGEYDKALVSLVICVVYAYVGLLCP